MFPRYNLYSKYILYYTDLTNTTKTGYTLSLQHWRRLSGSSCSSSYCQARSQDCWTSEVWPAAESCSYSPGCLAGQGEGGRAGAGQEGGAGVGPGGVTGSGGSSGGHGAILIFFHIS